ERDPPLLNEPTDVAHTHPDALGGLADREHLIEARRSGDVSPAGSRAVLGGGHSGSFLAQAACGSSGGCWVAERRGLAGEGVPGGSVAARMRALAARSSSRRSCLSARARMSRTWTGSTSGSVGRASSYR